MHRLARLASGAFALVAFVWLAAAVALIPLTWDAISEHGNAPTAFDVIVSAAMWVVLASPGLAGVAVTVREVFKAKRRRPAGACGTCGYDLRASPGRCPECGAAAGTQGGSASTGRVHVTPSAARKA